MPVSRSSGSWRNSGPKPPGLSLALAGHSSPQTSWRQRPATLPSPLRLLLHRSGRGRVDHPGYGRRPRPGACEEGRPEASGSTHCPLRAAETIGGYCGGEGRIAIVCCMGSQPWAWRIGKLTELATSRIKHTPGLAVRYALRHRALTSSSARQGTRRFRSPVALPSSYPAALPAPGVGLAPAGPMVSTAYSPLPIFFLGNIRDIRATHLP